MYKIMVIGGHAGDEEIMAGTLCYKYASRGHKVRFISLTAGQGGHPTLLPLKSMWCKKPRKPWLQQRT